MEEGTRASRAAGAGALPLALTVLTLAALTTLGQEFLFRGVVTTVPLRHGALVGVVGSAVVFALMRGVNGQVERVPPREALTRCEPYGGEFLDRNGGGGLKGRSMSANMGP
ncbi:CPBP family glutamic-type intramembrane protease [Nocardiopsis eucommiae]|uniref:CPBP family glutamic-type intramembrane protease n=1 Tax=Nocardiopsis eucommiae TaxID=2831970 RepID=UPI003D7150A4